jgi:hypothetical protein
MKRGTFLNSLSATLTTAAIILVIWRDYLVIGAIQCPNWRYNCNRAIKRTGTDGKTPHERHN